MLLSTTISLKLMTSLTDQTKEMNSIVEDREKWSKLRPTPIDELSSNQINEIEKGIKEVMQKKEAEPKAKKLTKNEITQKKLTEIKKKLAKKLKEKMSCDAEIKDLQERLKNDIAIKIKEKKELEVQVKNMQKAIKQHGANLKKLNANTKAGLDLLMGLSSEAVKIERKGKREKLKDFFRKFF